MEARTAESLPAEPGKWQYEPKWDGFRCLAFKTSDEIELRAKSGKPLGRYFPEVVAMLRQLAADRFVLDGELVIEQNGVLSFDALQMRLHPAQSRIDKLSRETPAVLMLFDMLEDARGVSRMDETLDARRRALEAFFKTVKPGRLRLSPYSRKLGDAKRWLDRAGRGALFVRRTLRPPPGGGGLSCHRPALPYGFPGPHSGDGGSRPQRSAAFHPADRHAV